MGWTTVHPNKNDPEDAAISAVEPTTLEYRSPAPESLQAEPVAAGGPLPELAAPESPGRRWTFFAIAVAITVLFFMGMMTFWVPAHSGVDQNGYLFGGRQVAQTGTMKFAPADPKTGEFDPHQFVGRMWVGADYELSTERFYPKYPIGLPLLVAIVLKLGGPDWGPWAVYLINPIAMSLAVLATFLLLRTFCGSFLAVLGQLVFASSPVVMLLSIDPNSHATAVFCVAWGMVGLFAWWKRGHPVVGFFAGLLIGYSVTIRYTEATLLLPVALVIAFRLGLGSKFWRLPIAAVKTGLAWATSRETDLATHRSTLTGLLNPFRDWIGAGLILLGWLIPVAGLFIYNLVAMGTPTGYDPTNESKPGASFNFDHAIDNWETTLRHLAVNGLFFLFPIAVLGLGWMFAWRRRPALVMAAWIVPCLVAYTFYYWAPDPQSNQDPRTFGNLGVSIGFLRFYTTILPALACCGIWAMGHLTTLVVARSHHWTTRLAAYAAVPVVVFLSCAVHVHNNARDLETTQYGRLNLQTNANQVLAVIKEPGSAIFFSDHGLFHHLQFARNYLLYDTQTYRENVVKGFMNNVDPDDAQGLDPGRSKSMYERLKGFDQRQLDDQQRAAALACLDIGKKVYVIESPVARQPNRRPRQVNDVVRRLTAKPTTEGTPQLYADVVSRWRFIVVPASVSETRDDAPKRGRPRQSRFKVQTATYETPWLIYQISKTPPEKPSPEMQAIIDFDAEQKAKNDADAAKRQADDKARREAEAKRREEDQQRTRAQQAAEQERVKKIQQQEQLLKELETRIAQSKAAFDKATADMTATTQQLTALKEQHAVANDAVKRAAADRQAVEGEMAKQRQQQQNLATELDDRTKQVAAAKQTLAETEKKLADARAALDRAKADEEKAKAETAKLKAEAEKLKQPPVPAYTPPPTTAPSTQPAV